MRINPLLLCIPSLAMAACSQAAAIAPDASNDRNCAIVGIVFAKAGQAMGAPEKQQNAIRVVSAWYVAKWQREDPGARAEMDETSADPVVKAIDADLKSYQQMMKDCTERAVEDPEFNRFAERTR